MIGFVKGVVEHKDGIGMVIDVSGVGYKVFVPHTISAKVTLGDKVKLFTFTHVREDLLELYGFLSPEELKLFEQLISVSGIGPKTALGVFALGSKDAILQAIIQGDVDFFTGVPRLGKKNAQKIIIDLKSRLGSNAELDLTTGEKVENKDVLDALKSFGFSAKEAVEAVREIKNQNISVEEKIRLALKHLGK